MRRLPALDGLRGIAILAVLLYHAGLLPGGFLGVDLFFVLSGFLITSLLVDELRATGRISLRDFYARRALRILPPLFATVALVLLLAPILKQPPLLPSLIFYANFVEEGSLGQLKHTWSLSVEEQFYLLWPALFVVLGRARVPFLVVVVLAAPMYRLAALDAGMPLIDVFRSSFARADTIALGCLAALAWVRTGAWAAAGVAGILAAFWCLAFGVMGWGLSAFALLCAATLLAVTGPGAVARLLSCASLRYLGSRSYGLYLYHLPLYLLAFSDAMPNSALARAFVAFACPFILAELSYRTIERWAAAQRKRFSIAHRPEIAPITA